MSVTNLSPGQTVNLANVLNSKLEAPLKQSEMGLDVPATKTGQPVRWDEYTKDTADILTINNHIVTYGYDANGNVQTVTEKDASNNTIKTVTYTYDPTSGNVTQSVTVINGNTVTTTYNYDVNGNITSTSNVIS